ncbi:MAG: cytochrome b/b6 domain-containing protein [Gammaproteobacteria bacterium]|jgi:cytochrome b|nr:cytochrome b/b6 domain-containing protein [Gammaproteobacteria bacterium]
MPSTDNTIRVWDPLVRAGHWLLALGFFVAYLTEDEWLTAHVWAGYTVATVVAVRLVWGLIGSEHARFTDFVCSPATTLQYLRDLLANRARRYVGHNPAGAAMVVALLLSVTGVAGSGMMLYAIEEDAGPLAGWVSASAAAPAWPALITAAHADDDERGEKYRGADDDEGEEFWEEVHELFADLTLFLVALHIAGVLFSSYAHDENLIRAMFTGRKQRD